MKNIDYRRILITLVRLSIGWHFLYEGFSKLLTGNWTSLGYLQNTSGALSGFYHWLAASPSLLRVVDVMNMYGLVLIGLGLFLGLLIRYASAAGVLLLALYYFAYPPFGNTLLNPGEGHLFIVDKLFIEASVLLFLIFYKEKGYSIDSFLQLLHKDKTNKAKAEVSSDTIQERRRELLKGLVSVPVLGVLGVAAFKHQKKFDTDVTSGATIQLKQAALGELKGTMPKGKIGNHEISRLVMGGNLIGGWAHSRDLLYVSSLFKAYNTEKKVYETLMLGEEAGLNSINIGFSSGPLMAKYKKITGSKIKVITQVAPNMDKKDPLDFINQAIDLGSDILQIQGNWCDWLVRDQKFEVIGQMMEYIRKQGITAGLGAHTVDSLIACEEKGLIPDYYMKTMHHDKYWSAHPRENRIPFEVDGPDSPDHNKYHNNMFDMFPERTVEFVNKSRVPVMGFKVLAAGAIEPQDGFRWAFENGADFICVGMFDFQLVSDVNITLDILNSKLNRQRAWMA
jgi:uncharacterized membrane protein YphA (DoxX/SURF4 family)